LHKFHQQNWAERSKRITESSKDIHHCHSLFFKSGTDRLAEEQDWKKEAGGNLGLTTRRFKF